MILVTGGSGFIGKNTVLGLLKGGDEVIAVNSPSDDGTLARLASDQLESGQLTIKHFNLGWTNPEDLPAADIIINLASASHVPTSIDDPVGVIRNNVALELTMLEYARRVEPDLFIQLSTEGVYGASYVDLEEWAPTLPSNPYAASKAAQEAVAISYWRTYGVPLSIVNTVNVFGPHQGADKFVPLIIRKLRAGEPIQIHGEKTEDGWDVGARAYEYVENIVDLFGFLSVRGVSSADTSVFPDRWHAAGLRRLANDELVELIADELGVLIELEYVQAGASRPGYDACYALDGSKLKLAGWSPPISLEEAIRETVAQS